MQKGLKELIEKYDHMLEVEGNEYMNRLLQRYKRRAERSNKTDHINKVAALEIVLIN